MLIDFNELQEMTIPGMNNGTGTMTARMYNDDSYRIIPTTLHPGGSIGEHTQDSGDDMNYILSGQGKLPVDQITVAPKNHMDLAGKGMTQYLDQLGYQIPVELSRLKLRY